MATLFLPMYGGLQMPNSSNTFFSSVKSSNIAAKAKKIATNQTGSMEVANDSIFQLQIMSGDSSTLSSLGKPLANISQLASRKTNWSLKENNPHMINRSDFFEDRPDLDLINTEDLLEEAQISLYDSNGTLSRPKPIFNIDQPENTSNKLTEQPVETSRPGFSSMSPPDWTYLDPIWTFTCQGRCGVDISFPCSCSATCIVYDSCCDDLPQDCPHIWEDGLHRFGHLSTADVICSKYSIYMISSCPRLHREKVKRKESEFQLTTISTVLRNFNPSLGTRRSSLQGSSAASETRDVIGISRANHIQPARYSQDFILERLYAALSEALVTDSDTGLTFLNKAIYKCNNMPESTALRWSLALDYDFLSPTKLEFFERFNFVNEYKLEYNNFILKPHQCLRNIIKTCNPTADQREIEIYADKCQKSNAIIFSTLGSPVFYRNIFCAYCNEGRHTEYMLHVSNFHFKGDTLQTLMSISESRTIKLRLSRPPERSRALLPWSYAQCSIPENKFSSSLEPKAEPKNLEPDSKDVCSVTCEGPVFTARSDGICKAQHHALLAIADDGLPPLSSSAMTRVGDFFACSLKNEVESLRYADVSSQSVSIMFDASTNKTLYVVKINLALPSMSQLVFSNAREDMVQNIRHVALLVKSFKDYRLSQNTCSHQDAGNHKAKVRVIRTTPLNGYIVTIGNNMTLAHSMEKLRGPILDRENITTVCLTTTSRGPETDPNLILCMEDFVHELDANLVNKSRNSPCFSYFENRNEAAVIIESKWLCFTNFSPISGGSSGRVVGYHPKGPGFDSQSGPSQIFIAPLCPPSTKWVASSLKIRRK
ncbi:hypothetical protein PoB_005810800 [Plakobranchus ocellatus]|uniref:SMB domain-containing protein n=1 Tax=Plakobranchus ocellatus TaxID=259542 RepID=A0AAV4CKK2_9GAST|nr:hypothetical protein PoB_005810800 [Plakobranchus ocellatus]